MAVVGSEGEGGVGCGEELDEVGEECSDDGGKGGSWIGGEGGS